MEVLASIARDLEAQHLSLHHLELHMSNEMGLAGLMPVAVSKDL